MFKKKNKLLSKVFDGKSLYGKQGKLYLKASLDLLILGEALLLVLFVLF